MPTPSRCLALAVLVASLPVLACGGTPSGTGDDGAGGTSATALPIDGLLLIDQIANPNHTGVLFDPHTGKSSPTAIGLTGAGTTFAVSPAGRHVAWWQDAYHLQVSPIQLDASGPSWGKPFTQEAKQNTNQLGGEVAFNSLGDRAYNHFLWWDFAGNKQVSCAMDGQQLVSPDGRHHVMTCPPAGTALYDDMTPVMPLPGLPTAFSPDGQWLLYPAGMVHVPSRSQLWHAAPKLPTGAVVTADGRSIVPAAGRRGTFVKTASAGGGGWVEIYEPETVNDPLGSSATFALFADPEVETAPQLAQFGLGQPESVYGLPEGTRWQLAGISADGQAAYVAIQTHKLIYHKDDNMITERLTSAGLRRVTLDGKVTDLHVTFPDDPQQAATANMGTCNQDIKYLAPVFGRQQVGLLEATDGIVLCGNANDISNAWLGFRGDQPVSGPLGTLPTLDGHAMLGGLEASHPQAVCLREIGSASSACMALNAPGTVIAVVGHAVPGLGRASPLPQPVWLSQSAAYPGQEVRLLGVGFGTVPATLSVGDAVVPAADVLAWTDTEIRFRGGAWQPASGGVTVTTAAGKSARQRLLTLRRTALWVSPGDEVPKAPLPVRQGLNRVAFKNAGSWALNLLGGAVDKVQPSPPLLPLTDPDAVEFYLAKADPAMKWLGFFSPRVVTYRPAVPTPGQDPQWPWNIVADYTGIEPPAGFAFEPLLDQLLLHGADVAIHAPQDPATPWLLDPLCVNHYTCPTALALLQPATQRADAGGATIFALDPAQNAVTRLTGFALSSGFLLPTFDASKQAQLPAPFEAIAAKGQSVLVMRKAQHPPAPGADHGVAISTDGGATFGPEIVPLPGQNLGPPLAAGEAAPAFFGFAVDPQGAFSVYRIDTAGKAQVDFAKGPPGLTLFTQRIAAELSGVLYLNDRAAHRLYALDTAAAAPAWQPVTANALDDHVLGVTADRAHQRLLVARSDGEVDAVVAPATVQTLATVQLGGYGGALNIKAVGAGADGRLLAIAQPAGKDLQLLLNQK